MNGVNCQVRTMTTVAIGCSVPQETTGSPRVLKAQLTIPMLVSNIEYFQISDAAAGMIRNGVIISVRAIARPRNWRSSSTANNNPNNSESTTENAVISTVATIEGHRLPEVSAVL